MQHSVNHLQDIKSDLFKYGSKWLQVNIGGLVGDDTDCPQYERSCCIE